MKGAHKQDIYALNDWGCCVSLYLQVGWDNCTISSVILVLT